MWLELTWKRFHWENNCLQKRIYEAGRHQDLAKICHFLRLQLNSYDARMLAIRQVNQRNNGKCIVGIDGKEMFTYFGSFQLERDRLQKAKKWKQEGLRKGGIPKSKERQEY
jgi:hypothetical protein